jgi:methionyl aminopeptidase
MQNEIIIKNQNQIFNIRESGKYLNQLLLKIHAKSKAWISLIELEFIAEDFLKKNNLKWAFKWYNWYPANLCLSVNDCVVHWIPDDYVLKNWDLLKIDCWINYNWWISDSAVSVVIGWELANPLAHKLMKSTKESLDIGIENIKNWWEIYHYSKAVFDHMKKNWFSVLEKLTWHWVGVKVHERPYVYNCPHPDTKKIKFQSWMVLAMEPITAVTSNDFISKPWNNWNLYCKNWDLWAQWEYTILITKNWYEILSWITENIWF